MELRHIVAAADESEEGRAAILAATELGRLGRARVSVLTVTVPQQEDRNVSRALAGLQAMVQNALVRVSQPPRLELAVASGLPGIEIGRFAETNRADLIVVGRKRRSSVQRLMIGDTADAVARRSRTPCLFVAAGPQKFQRVLVSLDGTERGMVVLVVAMDLARAAGAVLRVVTVEPAYDSEHGAPRVPTARSANLVEMVNVLRSGTEIGRGSWDAAAPGGGGASVVIHRGMVVEEILREADAWGADVLVLGFHRGGPADAIESGSVARRLAHESPCAVLTVPL